VRLGDFFSSRVRSLQIRENFRRNFRRWDIAERTRKAAENNAFANSLKSAPILREMQRENSGKFRSEPREN
jgi:hypothetical protein